MFKLLQTEMVEPYATTMLWTHKMVKDWTKRACKSNEPGAKKQRLIQYPPMLIVVEPTQSARAGTVRFLINNTFSDDITASILDANTVCIKGVHTPPGGNNNGLRREDDIPRGPWDPSNVLVNSRALFVITMHFSKQVFIPLLL